MNKAELYLSKKGLIVFYPISKDSTYQSSTTGVRRNYFDLESTEHIISFLTVFPPLEDDLIGELKSNFVSADIPEQFEDDVVIDDYDEDGRNCYVLFLIIFQ